MIRPAASADFETLRDIYNYYITETAITFDTEELTIAQVAEKLTINSKYPCLVYEHEGTVVGFIAASGWKAKEAYEQTVEVSIYIHPGNRGHGFGGVLFNELIKQLRHQGIHSVISGIIMPNDPSVALHQKFNFKKVAHFAEVGSKFGKWLDVSYWQLIL